MTKRHLRLVPPLPTCPQVSYVPPKPTPLRLIDAYTKESKQWTSES